jgi:hypothetical protein
MGQLQVHQKGAEVLAAKFSEYEEIDDNTTV